MLNKPSIVLLIALAIAMLCTACHNDAKSNVPDYPVRLDLQITAQYSHFIPENGFQTMTFTKAEKAGDYVGYAGVLVWVNTLNEYCAADMACPNCLKKDQPVQVDGLYATCPACGEAFDLSQYGYPSKGKTNQPLRRYSTQTVYEGMNRVLRVRN